MNNALAAGAALMGILMMNNIASVLDSPVICYLMLSLYLQKKIYLNEYWHKLISIMFAWWLAASL